jgi:hypothetical protein
MEKKSKTKRDGEQEKGQRRSTFFVSFVSYGELNSFVPILKYLSRTFERLLRRKYLFRPNTVKDRLPIRQEKILQ